MRGPEVLEHMRNSNRCRDTVVIVVSTSDSVAEKAQLTKLGANDYFTKPSSYDEFMKLGALIKAHSPTS